MKTKIAFVPLLALFLSITSFAAPEKTPSLVQFDEDVAQCRRVVRKSCAVVQEMMKDPQTDKTKQETGLVLLRNARKQWRTVQEKWGNNPPPEYTSDVSFRMRLQDFSNALEDMEKALVSGDAHRSFTACGSGCALFVTMHEENGLTYALDALFHLRKSMKTAGAVMKARGSEHVRLILPDLMQLRDAVLLAPLPWPAGDERNKSYDETIRQLSRAFDEWILSITSQTSAEAETHYARLMDMINKAYGMAL